MSRLNVLPSVSSIQIRCVARSVLVSASVGPSRDAMAMRLQSVESEKPLIAQPSLPSLRKSVTTRSAPLAESRAIKLSLSAATWRTKRNVPAGRAGPSARPAPPSALGEPPSLPLVLPPPPELLQAKTAAEARMRIAPAAREEKQYIRTSDIAPPRARERMNPQKPSHGRRCPRHETAHVARPRNAMARGCHP
ncbi:MAG: hypothetical protein QM702_21395 [Rubrivivax sp.]